MSDLGPESNPYVVGIIYAAAALLIGWLARILGFFGGKQIDRLKVVEDKQTATDSRVNVLEATVVKDKELNKILKEFKKDVDNRFNTVNNNIDATREDMRGEFKTEHSETRKSNKEEIADLKKFFTELYSKERKG